MEHPSVKGVLQTVVIAREGSLLAAAIPLQHVALTDPVTVAIPVVSLSLLLVHAMDHPRARANGGHRSARTMSGIPTARGISQYMK
jgi:hypothetical protein